MGEPSGFGLSDVEARVWPQRLLRISDMTSYECEMIGPDAFFMDGQDKNPEYAILSYTWGRFRVDGRNGGYTEGAIDIQGVDWSIPQIDPVRGFSVDEFENILEVVAGDYEYIWLDVACIDQDEDVSGEIGRQAAIFDRASEAYIWLYQQQRDSDDVRLADRISEIVDYISGFASAERDARLRHQELILGLLHDPWFSSLWTLQEAFLKKDAIILTRTGETTPVTRNDGTREPLTLALLLDLCRDYLAYEFTGQDRLAGDYEIKEAIKRVGLDSLAAANPLVLLRDACHRVCTKPQDRVLGIQQVFGVALQGDLPSLGAQERQLSMLMNQRCPALAQLFYTAYAQTDKPSWQIYIGVSTTGTLYRTNPTAETVGPIRVRRGRINGRVAGIEDVIHVPDAFFNAQAVADGPDSTRLQPRVEPGRDHLSLYLEGFAFALEDLRDFWWETERHRIPPREEDGRYQGPAFYPSPEEVPYQNSFSCSIFSDSGFGGAPGGFEQMIRPLPRIEEMCEKWPKQVNVFILGKIQSGPATPHVQAWVGILVVNHNSRRRRIGFCTWKDDFGDLDVSDYAISLY